MANFLQSQETFKRSFKLQKELLLLENQQAERAQNLQERIESLKIHHNIIQSAPKTTYSNDNQALISLLFTSHTQIHSLFSQQLLRNQVQIHKQSEMTETIQKYEHKIAELGSILKSKQAQLADLQGQLNPQPKISRQNLRTFKNQALSKSTVKRQLIEVQRLKMEVRDLEQEAMDYGRIRSRNNSGSFEDILQDFTTYFHEQTNLNPLKMTAPTKFKSSGLHKDTLVMKSMQLYELQMERQEQQRKELLQLEEQLMDVTNQNQSLCHQYKKLCNLEDVSLSFQENPEDFSDETTKSFTLLQTIENQFQLFGVKFLSEKDINCAYSSNSKPAHPKKFLNCLQRSERFLKQN